MSFHLQLRIPDELAQRLESLRRAARDESAGAVTRTDVVLGLLADGIARRAELARKIELQRVRRAARRVKSPAA